MNHELLLMINYMDNYTIITCSTKNNDYETLYHYGRRGGPDNDRVYF